MSKYLKATVMIIAFSSIVIGAVLGKSYYDKQKTQQHFEQLIKTAQEKNNTLAF